ncbi:MAG: N-6 DNA methylase [Endomicrobium sp.]|jgi:type I restriction enzyme M protein|nr:N-6 DNA methylase [Endomicrobium sp.]
MDLIAEGLKKGLISFDDEKERRFITYIFQNNKKRLFTNPEEAIQAESYLKLIFKYHYKPQRIKLYVPVKMGTLTKEADIVVYNDDECMQPYILVECKHQEITELEFQAAIKQAYSYAFALPNDIKYIWITSRIRNEYFKVDKQKQSRITQPDIPQSGVKKLTNYKYVYNAAKMKHGEGSQQFEDLSIISQDELTKRFKQAHDALWGGGQLNPSEAFDELDKLIFCKIWDERKGRAAGTPYDFQIITADKEEIKSYKKLSEKELEQAIRNKENELLAKRIFCLYEEGRKKDPEVFRDNIRLSPEKIRTVVGYLESVNLGETDLDAKGRAFETFMDSFFRGNFGQYFTPRPIVKFITDVLPITNDSKVLDTSCGSGGFLLYCLDKVRKAANKLYPEFKTDISESKKHYKYWHVFAEKNLFGIEINEQISRAAKMNMIIHDDGHTNVISADGLLSPKKLEEISGNKGFKYNNFDFIVTNPPFGSIVRLTERAYLKEYKLGKKEEYWLALKAENEEKLERQNQSTEVLFIEQSHKFLKEGGYLGIVIPDGILTNSSLQYVRNLIEDWFRIIAVVSMPQTAFASTGAGVKSSVLFLRKWTKEETDTIEQQKTALQAKIKLKNKYLEKIESLNNEKKEVLKEHKGFENKTGKTNKKDIEKTEEFKAWKIEINESRIQQINDVKEELNDLYQKEKAKTLADYPIFMAIAEEIGYDAAGRKTTANELDIIGQELKKFIEAVENGRI